MNGTTGETLTMDTMKHEILPARISLRNRDTDEGAGIGGIRPVDYVTVTSPDGSDHFTLLYEEIWNIVKDYRDTGLAFELPDERTQVEQVADDIIETAEALTDELRDVNEAIEALITERLRFNQNMALIATLTPA